MAKSRSNFPSENKANSSRGPILQMAISLLAFLLAMYSLTYSGTFVTDDEHILASRTISLAWDANVNDGRVYGNSRVYALASLPAEGASQALNIEPAQEIAGYGLSRLAGWLHTGQVQTIFLLNLWVVALTAVVLFITVILLGYSSFTALIVAILFGLGTLAWPYSRTYFRDPLAMLFLAISWGSLQILLAKREVWAGRPWYRPAWLIPGFSLIAGILAKNTVAVAIPVLLFEAVTNIHSLRERIVIYSKFIWGKKRRTLILLSTLVLFLLALLAIIFPSPRHAGAVFPGLLFLAGSFFPDNRASEFFGCHCRPVGQPRKEHFSIFPNLASGNYCAVLRLEICPGSLVLYHSVDYCAGFILRWKLVGSHQLGIAVQPSCHSPAHARCTAPNRPLAQKCQGQNRGAVTRADFFWRPIDGCTATAPGNITSHLKRHPAGYGCGRAVEYEIFRFDLELELSLIWRAPRSGVASKSWHERHSHPFGIRDRAGSSHPGTRLVQ